MTQSFDYEIYGIGGSTEISASVGQDVAKGERQETQEGVETTVTSTVTIPPCTRT